MPTMIQLAVLAFLTASAQTRAAETTIAIRADDGLELRGVLREAEGSSTPSAAALILQGSGLVGANGDVSGPILGGGYRGQPAPLSEQIAGTLSARGIATLRFGKRGSENPASAKTPTIQTIASDAKAAAAALRSAYPAIPVFCVGFSEGALAGAMNAGAFDALFLIAPAARPFDELLSYQFLDWPVDLLRRKLDRDGDGMIDAAELSQVKAASQPPLLHAFMGVTWDGLDADKDGAISLAAEAAVAYGKLLAGAHLMLQGGETTQDWYHSMRKISPLAAFLDGYAKPVFTYQSLDDAQVNWTWVVAEPAFGIKRLFLGVGHAFSPHEGAFGEIKTGGPLSNDLLEALASDMAHAAKN